MLPGLFALAVAAFAIGTTEFVIVGLIPEMARELSVFIRAAGLLASLYALSITLGERRSIFSGIRAMRPR